MFICEREKYVMSLTKKKGNQLFRLTVMPLGIIYSGLLLSFRIWEFHFEYEKH